MACTVWQGCRVLRVDILSRQACWALFGWQAGLLQQTWEIFS